MADRVASRRVRSNGTRSVSDWISRSGRLTLGFGLARRSVGRKLERNIDNHIFLSTNAPSFAEFDENRSNINSVSFRGFLCVTQEARIDAGITEGKCFAIDTHG